MAIDRVGSGSAAQRASEQLAQGRAAPARVATPGTGGAGARRAADATSDATGIIARAAARAGNLHALTAKAESVSAALEETTGLLDEMREILRDQANSSKGGGLEEVRVRVADIAASIARAEAKASGEATGGVEISALTSAQGPPAFQQGFIIANVNPGVEKVTGKSLLPPGAFRDIELDVTSSAVSAEFQLWFKTESLDLSSANSQFRIEVGGAIGSQELSFASGTSYQNMVDAINSFTSTTGVTARVGPYSQIYLSSPPEDGSFVSVRVLDDGGVVGGGIQGVVGGKRFKDMDPSEEFRENGSAFHATIAGEPITISGNTIDSHTSEWDLRITLDLERFNHSGSYSLFLLFSTPGPVFQGEDPPPEFGEPIQGAIDTLGQANTLASNTANTTAETAPDAIDALRAQLGDRLTAVRDLLNGPLADATSAADATLQSLIREGPKSGWRIDAKG